MGMANTEIAEYLGMSRPTVSVHAKILRQAGLIRSRQDGRLVRHEIVPAEVRRLFHDLERFLDLPEEGLAHRRGAEDAEKLQDEAPATAAPLR